MSDATGKQTETCELGDAPDGTLLQTGEVNYEGKKHQLFLTLRGLRLLAEQNKNNTGAGGKARNVPLLDLEWRDMICACEVPIKKSKSSQRHSNAGSPDGSQSKLFAVHYIERQKTNNLHCRDIILESVQGTAEKWISQIEEKCKEGKPQHLLIIINPIGGKGNARQVFDKQVQPLFVLAGVELIIKVTERAKHTIEIAKTFDVSSVDGIIVMGGDGSYAEILHGLTLRKQEEDGVDFNNSDAKLVPPTIPVGLIPAGTGNGQTISFNGVTDVKTATLNIIRGETSKASIYSIHEAGKLIHYGGFLLGTGFFSELMKKTDELRWMKRMRYGCAVLSSLFWKKKILEIDIEVLRNEQESSDREDTNTDGAAAVAESGGWIHLGIKQSTATGCIPASFMVDGEQVEINPFLPGCSLFILDNASTMDTFRFLISFVMKKKSGLEKEYVEWVRNIHGMRFKLVEKPEEEVSSARRTQLQEIFKLVNLDGEVILLNELSYDVRLHSQFLPVFCAPGIYCSEKKS